MLSHDQLHQLYQDLGLSHEAQTIIEHIRSAPPSRRVRSVAGNVSVRYPSRKMGVTIQAESHRNELAGIYEYEHDPAILEYYDQPPPIKLVYLAKSGRRVGVVHTPDYFVLRVDGVGWEEWKMAVELERLAESMPHRYRQHEQGQWHCPPGEAYAQPLGCFYRVRSSAEIDWVLQRNLLFLEDYLRADRLRVDEQAARILRRLVAQQPGILLSDLLRRAIGVDSDELYWLIATERLFVDLHAAALAEPERVRVYRDAASAQAVRMATSKPHAFPSLPAPDSPADRSVLPVPAAQGISRAAQERLAQASEEDLAEANRRYALLAPQLTGSPPVASGVSGRTLRRWLARWRAADRDDRCGYVGLLPRLNQSGNRSRKLPDATLRQLDAVIATTYETHTQKRKFAAYATLVRACEEQGLVVPSYKTFVLAVNRRPRQEQVAKRQGPRAAAQEAPFYWELHLTTPRHGDRPFEIVHIDHTQLDVELVCSRTGHPLGRPWATFLTDACTRRLLAACLLFDSPSYRSCMLVLRACVRRHQRLPQTVVVDGGAEFASVYFETLLARYGCTKKTRPGARPRFGSVCERLFGTTNTRFVHNLLGNTQILRQVRQVTKAVDPRRQACWTLAALAARVDEWAFEVYDTIAHPALGRSPREAFAAGLAQGGARRHQRILDDEDFRMATLPTTERGTARLQRRLGVKLHHIYYWADAFLDPALEGTALPVRYDPFDVGIAYAFVKGRWVQCISEHYARLTGHSEREVQLASMELRRRAQLHVQQLPVTARRLADFLGSLEAEQVLLEQRLRDAALREAVAGAQMHGPTQAARAPERSSDVEPAGGNGPAPLVVYGDY